MTLTICSTSTRLGERTVRFDEKVKVLLTRQDVGYSADLVWNKQILNPNQTFESYGIANGDVIIKVQRELWDETGKLQRWEELSKEDKFSTEVRSLISARAKRRKVVDVNNLDPGHNGILDILEPTEAVDAGAHRNDTLKLPQLNLYGPSTTIRSLDL